MGKLGSVTGAWLLSAGAAACTTHVVADGAPTGAVAARTFFEPCARDLECGAPALCERITVDYGSHAVSDAFCTMDCLDDRDCPHTGLCIDAFGGRPLCAEACVVDADCAIGFGCVEQLFDPTGPPGCLPI